MSSNYDARHCATSSILLLHIFSLEPCFQTPLLQLISLLVPLRFSHLSLISCVAALRRSDGNYVINGNWAINWSGVYEAVGTRFTYRRQDANNGELIEAPGPLLEPVDLMVSAGGHKVSGYVPNMPAGTDFSRHLDCGLI
jgi:hypothetical protein